MKSDKTLIIASDWQVWFYSNHEYVECRLWQTSGLNKLSRQIILLCKELFSEFKWEGFGWCFGGGVCEIFGFGLGFVGGGGGGGFFPYKITWMAYPERFRD